jgi:Uma2 family endonuclease
VSTARPAARRAEISDFYAIAEAERFHELIDGTIVEKAAPSGEHAGAQTGIILTIGGPFQRGAGRGGPGGWWILTEVEVQLDAHIVRPDVAGWHRERCPERPTGMPVTQRPDWICEVLSPSNSSNDRVKKLRLYHQVGVPHYWLVDPTEATLMVLRWSEAGYVTVLSAERGETVRAEPFADIEIAVGTLFGDDPA